MNLSQALEHANALVFPGFLSDDETLTAEREKNEEGHRPSDGRVGERACGQGALFV